MRLTRTCKHLESLMGVVIMSHHYGDVYDIWNNTDIVYPALCYDLVSGEVQDSMNVYTFRVYIADRLLEDGSNVLYCHDTAEGCFRTLLAMIDNRPEFLSAEITTITPFVQKFADNLAGYWADITVQTANDLDNC